MYIKKSLAVVSALVVLAVGYVAGSFIGFPNVDNSMLKGDISKANSFNQADSPEVQAALEQLTNDKELQKQTAAAAALLDARINQMQELASGDDDEWIPDSIECPILWETFDLSSVGKRLQNTREAYDQYLDALAAALKGEKTEGFEQKANNALLAYTVAERNIEALAPEVSSALLQAAEQTGNKKLAEKAAQWIQYSSESAFLSGSESDMAYWQSQADIIANSPVLGKMLNATILCCNDMSSLSSKLLAVTPSKTLEMMLGTNSNSLLNQDKILGLIVIDKRSDVAGLALAPVLGLRWY